MSDPRGEDSHTHSSTAAQVGRNASGRASGVRHLVLFFCGTVWASAYLTRNCLGLFNTTMQKQLGLSPEQTGYILGAFGVGYFIFQVPGGWLGLRYGTRWSLGIISVVWSFFTLWTAWAGAFIPLVASRVAFGAAQAGLVPLTSLVVKDWFPLSRRGFASSINTAAMSLGGVITMYLTSKLMGHIDWRMILAIYSIVGFIWAAAFLALFRTKPDEHPWVNESELRIIRSTAVAHPTEPAEPAKMTRSGENPLADKMAAEASEASSAVVENEDLTPPGIVALCMLSSASLWGVCMQVFFRSAGYMAYVTWFPAFLEKRYNLTAEQAGVMTTWLIAGVAAGSIFGGILIDWLLRRTGSRWLSRTGLPIVSLFICAAFTFGSAWADTSGMLVASMSIGAFFFGVANPTTWAATMDIAGKHTAIVMGIMNMFSSVGGVLMPIFLGYMFGNIENSGGDWNQVVYLFAFVFLCAALCWLPVNPNHICTKPRTNK